ncbi:MAG: cytochrome c oxidase assembly protein, partial [Solirubrobacterales bacterium]|nr:cytochrome c oxidase assembly protein [Solirubrobacterales bacterium]
WPARRTASFLAGVACAVVALQSGIDAYDDQLLSVHMVQHMLLLLVAPLLVLGGRPVILALRALPPARRRGFVRALERTRAYTGPLQTLVVFGAVIVLTHLPSFYEATLRHPALHYTEHALYLTAGLLMWSPLLDGDPAPRHRLGGLGRFGYLIAAMLPMAVVGAYLNRHAALVYPSYGPPARSLGLSALDDQGQAGAIMWVVGSTIMVAVGLWAAVAAMVAEERRQAARDARAAPLARQDPAARSAPLAAPDGGARG